MTFTRQIDVFSDTMKLNWNTNMFKVRAVVRREDKTERKKYGFKHKFVSQLTVG
jgi:hypothetical protein